MPTLTYCKGFPVSENNNWLGQSPMEMFLFAYAPIFRRAVTETLNHLQSVKTLDKSGWNTYLQQTYLVNKRHANGMISYAIGLVKSAAQCRQQHLKTLNGQLKSVKDWIKKTDTKLKKAREFYQKKNWCNSKTRCVLPLSSSLKSQSTNWHSLKFRLHHKKRFCALLEQKIQHLQSRPLRVVVPLDQVFIVGSFDETCGNSVCQWDGHNINLRVPKCLSSRFGEYVEFPIGDFQRKINRIPDNGAKTWHFYRKLGKWNAAIQFTPAPVECISRHSRYGCLGIDLNPGSIGWAYLDLHGNLKAKGKIPLQTGLPTADQNAQIVDACLKLVALARKYACPIVCEQLDFALKKEQLRERGKKYARMLSGWAYARFFELLDSIASNRGISVLKVNPAFTSVIGMVKYARQYGLSSDCAAAVAIARRGMGLTEKIPGSITAYLPVKDRKHVWSRWRKLNTILTEFVANRHVYYNIPNWGLEVSASG